MLVTSLLIIVVSGICCAALVGVRPHHQNETVICALLWVIAGSGLLREVCAFRSGAGGSFSELGLERIVAVLPVVATVAFIGFILLTYAIRRRGIPKQGLGIWFGLMLVVATQHLAVVGGVEVRWDVYLIFVPLIFSAIAMTRHISSDTYVSHIQAIILTICVGGLLAAVFLPTWWGFHASNGIIPGVPIRLRGLMLHSNGFGAAALFGILFLWLRPIPRKWVHVSALAVLILSVLLSQSKTSWGIGLMCLGIYHLTSIRWERHRWLSRLALNLAILFVTISGLTVVASTIFDPGSFYTEAKLASATGRTDIWAVALDLWKQHPLLGYGPVWWGEEMNLGSYQSAIADARSHVHNQFIQALVETGIVGLAGLICYTVIVGRHSFRLARTTNWAALGIFIFFIGRQLTESWLRGTTVDLSMFIHVAIFGYLIYRNRDDTRHLFV